MDDCCQAAGDAIFLKDFGIEDAIGSQGFTDYLKSVVQRWGKLARGWADELILKTSYRRDFMNARVCNVKCRNGHVRPLVVVGARLTFFIWRINMLLADYWTLAKDSEGGLKPKPHTDFWPPKTLIEELSEVVSIYFSGDDLSLTNFSKLNRIISNYHPASLLTYISIVDLAELFILFHEFQHVLPLPHNFQIRFKLAQDLFISEKRQEKWLREYIADANSAKFLWISATNILKENYRLDVPDAKKTAARLVFSGADAALHTLAMLERIHYSEIPPEDAGKGSEYRTHPPSSRRRTILSHICKDLCLEQMDDSTWTTVRKSIAALMIPRDKLFDAFFTSKGDLVTNIRQGGVV